MTERIMARRRRSQQRHRRNTIATWLVGTVCGAMLVFLAAIGCRDYLNKLPPKDSQTGLPSLMLKETGQDASQPQEAAQTVYQDGTDWNLRLVNRWNAIPEGYRVNLKELPGGEQVDERIYEPLREMLEAAKEGNWNEYKLEGYSEEEAIAEAGKWVALPGTSEHQLGLAVDVEGTTYDVFLWLQENSYRYGFIFRYPGDKTDITGTVEEVWHYRYVGKEAATEIYEQGLCLEEYTERKGGV